MEVSLVWDLSPNRCNWCGWICQRFLAFSFPWIRVFHPKIHRPIHSPNVSLGPPRSKESSNGVVIRMCMEKYGNLPIWPRWKVWEIESTQSGPGGLLPHLPLENPKPLCTTPPTPTSTPQETKRRTVVRRGLDQGSMWFPAPPLVKGFWFTMVCEKCTTFSSYTTEFLQKSTQVVRSCSRAVVRFNRTQLCRWTVDRGIVDVVHESTWFCILTVFSLSRDWFGSGIIAATWFIILGSDC